MEVGSHCERSLFLLRWRFVGCSRFLRAGRKRASREATASTTPTIDQSLEGKAPSSEDFAGRERVVYEVQKRIGRECFEKIACDRGGRDGESHALTRQEIEHKCGVVAGREMDRVSFRSSRAIRTSRKAKTVYVIRGWREAQQMIKAENESALSNGRPTRAYRFRGVARNQKRLKDRKKKYGEYSVHADYQWRIVELDLPDAQRTPHRKPTG